MTQECNIDKINHALSDLLEQLNHRQLSNTPTINNNEPQSEKQLEEKKQSWWIRVRESVRKLGKVKSKGVYEASDSGGSQGGSGRRRRNGRKIGEDQEDANLEIQKLKSDIRQMKTAFENLTRFQSQMSMSLELDLPLNKLKGILEKTDSMRSRAHDLKEIRRKIFNLKCKIPSLLLKQSSTSLSTTDDQTVEDNSKISETGSDIYLPGLYYSEDFKHSLAFQEVLEKFQSLDFTQKLCFLSFAVFPENKEVKRTMLMYWWIGEGFLSPEDSENSVKIILDELSKKSLLDPVEDERKLKPNSYKMEPHVHSSVIYLAKFTELFDLYNSKGKLRMKKSPKDKVCLIKGSSMLQKVKTLAMQPKTLKTIFNSSERYPDFVFRWFPLMESLRVLYLGRWERTATRHIEVEITDFLKDIKSLKNLRLVSFQGISRIEKLENPICLLPKLVILDLRACYNLEGLPEDIGLLENLIYLDVSECFMLDRMPKGISQLSKLQVLKGFVISQNDDESKCAFRHLVNLRKLSITVNKYHFKVENLMESLRGLERLESLKIAWGFSEYDQRGETSETNHEKQSDLEKEKKHKDLKKQENENKEEIVEEDKSKSENKASPSSQEAIRPIESTQDEHKGKSNVEGYVDKVEDDVEQIKKKDDVEEEISKSNNHLEGAKKASPPRESTDEIKNKKDDQNKEEKGEDVENEKVTTTLDEAKNKDEVKEETSKPDKVTEGDKKENPPQESKEKTPTFGKKVSFSEIPEPMIQKKPNYPENTGAMREKIRETPPKSKEPRPRKEKLFATRYETKKWGRKYQDTIPIEPSKLPSSLKKLELECFPEKYPPSWLNPENLEKNLEKLYIKGGKLSKISNDFITTENSCSVRILRLKYLHEFKAEWKDLRSMFPKMVLLEKYQCPKIAFCPTDGNGVWKLQP